MSPPTLWRMARAPYADLSGEGARRFGGRWNPVGVPMLYATTSLSLAVLEMLVHTDPDLVPGDSVALRLSLPEVSSEIHDDETLPPQWRDEVGSAHTQAFGAEWVESGRSALLILPSVLLPAEAGASEMNVLINPLHPEAAGVAVSATVPFTFDPRLLAG